MNKNILFILHLPPPVHGAAMVGKYIQESNLINSNFNGDYINLSTSNSLEDIGKGGGAKLVSLLKLQYKVLRALLEKKYHLCYVTLTAQGNGFYKDVLVIAILKIFRKKIVYHFHNKGVAKSQESWINDLLYRFVFKGTKSILLSQHLYPDVQKYVKKEDAYFCPNGIPLSAGMLKEQPIVKDPRRPFNILFLSNMMEEKGVWTLLEACKHLLEKGLSFECHFIGAWSDIQEQEFAEKISLSNLSNIVFAHGKKYNDEKNSFFERADVFVFPTYYHNEAFSLVLLEAMQFSLPVISTNEGGIPDIVHPSTGFLVPKKDPTALAEKIQWLMEHPEERLQMGFSGKNRFKENFTISIFEENINRILTTAYKN